MKKARTFSILFIIIICNLTIAQDCEKYDRNLFHILPDNFPDQINCRDSLGLRQGWWVNYKIQSNSIDKSYEQTKEKCVANYTYGVFKDNVKIGDWISVTNVPPVCIKRKDNYYYSQDTFLITSGFEEDGWNESSVYYSSDTSVIRSTSLAPNDKFPICIECINSRLEDKECIMTYRDRKIKEFPFDEFDFEFFRSFSDYKREKWLIDEIINKKKINK